MEVIEISSASIYVKNDKEDASIRIPGASILRKQINQLCCQEYETKGATEVANDQILESISEEFMDKKEVAGSLKN